MTTFSCASAFVSQPLINNMQTPAIDMNCRIVPSKDHAGALSRKCIEEELQNKQPNMGNHLMRHFEL